MSQRRIVVLLLGVVLVLKALIGPAPGVVAWSELGFGLGLIVFSFLTFKKRPA